MMSVQVRQGGPRLSATEAEAMIAKNLPPIDHHGEIVESDRVFAPGGSWVVAGEMAELKPLFDLKRKSKSTPPRCCRTHTDRLAHFLCTGADRPLCEECAPEKTIGATVVRICSHCGGPTVAAP